MKIFDVHSHWGTRRGYPLRTEAELALQKTVWNSEPRYDTEEEMADYFRAQGVQVILDLGFTKYLPLDEVRAHHDYALEMQARHSDVIFGLWLQIHPKNGDAGVIELERCMQASKGFVGYMVVGAGLGYPCDDPIYTPYYDVSEAGKRPVLVLVGYNGGGAGHPGGGGMILDHCHPRFVDTLAARRPNLTIVAGRPAWPWQDEMIAVLLHKPNVWYELHGWSPKYLTDALKRDIPRRLKNRVMFGADYPLFTYERLVADWRSLGYDDAILAQVMQGNAARLFGLDQAA
jgi:predicted TIM-barrel fold metal-dependent hydrolase